MAGWRERILDRFVPGVQRITVAADPDELLTDERIREGIRARGFEVMVYRGPIAFRFEYELKHRAQWDLGTKHDLAIIVQDQESEVRSLLPCDVLARSRTVSFDLGWLFPGLCGPVVAELGSEHFDALDAALSEDSPGRLGESETRDFILRRVFGVDCDSLTEPIDVLEMLLNLHYAGTQLPRSLSARVARRLGARFPEWPLESLVGDREWFFSFVQEQWHLVVGGIISRSTEGQGAQAAGGLDGIPAKSILPLSDRKAQPYVEKMFDEGLLKPIVVRETELITESWTRAGIVIDQEAEALRRLDALIARVSADLPQLDALHGQWLGFARRAWAPLRYEWNTTTREVAAQRRQQIADVETLVDARFGEWVRHHFGLLHDQTRPPTLVHHIPGAMRRVLDEGKRVALIVCDGLSLDQWLIVRDSLNLPVSGLRVDESAVFAWIPTITQVSRQALFSGRTPLQIESHLGDTRRESQLWEEYWREHNMGGRSVAYVKNITDERALDEVRDAVGKPGVRVVGLIVGAVDSIMHGCSMGMREMYIDLQEWCARGVTSCILKDLTARGFVVFLTSDHGNVEATGCGRPGEGSLPETRGQRVLVYRDPVLFERAKAKFPDAIPWSPPGLPENYHIVLAPGREAFVSEGETVVCHGGIALEELVVPFVRIEGD